MNLGKYGLSASIEGTVNVQTNQLRASPDEGKKLKII